MPETVPSVVSELLTKWNAGDQEALGTSVPLRYDDLHQVAHRHLRKARPGQTLQTTALVNEAYLRLEQHQHARFENRSHFVAICDEVEAVHSD